MTNRITPERIKKMNRHMIYKYIYDGREVSQQDISCALNLSRPTMTVHLAAMEKEGLLLRKGRKPLRWSINAGYRIAIGVEIMKHTVKIIAVNLYGEALKCVRLPCEYENNENYYHNISRKVKEFIETVNLTGEGDKILGVGFALQGLMSEDGTTVIYGEILKCTGLKIEVFTKWLDYPCRFIHEPDGAALSELWVSPELDNAVYLSMSEHLGGAIISGRKVLNGMHRHASTFEHITAVPDGELCYCGKIGCYETVCAKTALLRGEDPDEFFRRVRSSEPEALNRWGIFLRHLGRLIAHMHLVIDTKYILGGHLAPYFTSEDIKLLYKYVRERTPFIEEDDYILQSKMPSHNITIGAALPYVINFLDKVGYE